MRRVLIIFAILAVGLVGGGYMLDALLGAPAQGRPEGMLAQAPGDRPVYSIKVADGTFILLRETGGKLSISHWRPGLLDQELKTEKPTALTAEQPAVFAQLPFSLGLFSEQRAIPLIAYGGKVLDGVDAIRLEFDDGSEVGPMRVSGQYFVYIGEAKADGPKLTRIHALDQRGRELFAHAGQ